MTRRLTAFLAGAAAIALLAGAPAGAQAPLDRSAIEKIVHEYIVAHPEVLEEAMAALEKKQVEEASAGLAKVLAEKKATLFESPRQVTLGNPKGDITVVEFFDYNCGYCKTALPDLLALIAADPKVKVVLKEMPILSDASVEAARVSIAVGRVAPAKFQDFHKRLIGTRGSSDLAKAMAAARDAGVDAAALDKALADAEIDATIAESYGLAKALGIRGTPGFVIGDKVIPGRIELPALKARVAEARCTLNKNC
ncbi:MAG: DsbA family protein [Siculibacillus sp.]|nr:DsbA family protein [Siculibacillus sp.]